MTFTTAYLEKRGNDPLQHEERLVEQELNRRGTPINFYQEKQIRRRTLPLDEHAFIMGGVPSMQGAMKQLGIIVPEPNDYPASLKNWLKRRVWSTTLREFEEVVFEGLEEPIFAKPAGRLKNFTGRVVQSAHDLRWMAGASRRQQIWCSEVVPWIAEYRVYVIRGRIVSVDLYDGDLRDAVSRSTIEEAVAEYQQSGEAPSAYGIDFGVLRNGETALVEANDGYSLGAYNISSADYTNLLFTRWQELLDSLTSSPAP